MSLKLAILLVVLGLISINVSGFVLQKKGFKHLTTEEKCYGFILDCGSSSTKVTVYEWACH